MIRVGASQETLREISRLLDEYNKKELESKKKIKEEVEEEVEERTEERTEDTDDDYLKRNEEYNKQILESYKPKKISYLTIDKYDTKIVEKDRPIIFGAGACPCGGSITKANKARHIKSYRHQRYMSNLASE